ncbi:hypothetical protein [Tichowtungia aerotolerans]|uniref:Uncharacterized protein n=1 Tax=Tichowtungia aerotolerans TaxID=2697043 RepID=A0A6P1M733_9BACT|nr:hypothetical protein [Tichowtungia aerotolerans]QHI68833.1 hypothetical protein GT409_05000 [Tichowtungia aerotolerans]
MKKTVLASFAIAASCSAAPWWDDFPRIVSDSTSQQIHVTTNHHGNVNMNANGQDPSWGTFFQADGIVRKTSWIEKFQGAGLKQIGYFETYGQSYCLVAELEAWDQTNLTPILHHHWSWKSYSGGTIRWLGAKDFFDDEEFARPYTRTHPRYGGPAMTYPDGTLATGYDGPHTDPRNSRVYDAACSKNVLGELSIDDYRSIDGAPTNGLVYVEESDSYAGLIMFKKDSACPFWNDYTYASTLQAADAGIDGMWTDNYGPWDSLGSTPVKRGFGDWSVARFRDHLANSFSSVDLLSMGIADVSTFDIREYLRAEASAFGWDGSNLNSSVWKDSRWLDDPLWRAYLIFKRQVGTEALSGYYAAVKSAAAAAGNDEFLVAGNDIPGFSLGWSRGDLDMVSTEMSLGYKTSSGPDGFTLPPVGRYAPFYKLAREHAQSRFVNVWLYNDSYEAELAHPELCHALYYEMLATHTFPKFDPASSRIPGDEQTNTGFFEFVEFVAPIYGDRIPVEKVGLYYSSSSILRQMTPGGFVDFNGQPHQFSFWGWATALTELHIPYRVLPEWKLNAEELAGLDLLILPNVDVLDPADVSGVLELWLNAGGRLVIAGDCGIYLGESGNFALNTNGLSVASIMNHANVTVLPGNLGMDYYLAYENRSAAQRAQFDAALNDLAPRVETTASHKTGITLYADEGAGRFFMDVNNVDIDINSYTVTGTGSVEIEAELPAWLCGKDLQVKVVSPDDAMINLIDAADTNHVKIALSSIDRYVGVIIEEAVHWADPGHSGSWNVATNWIPSAPAADNGVVWNYAPGNPSITINEPAEAGWFKASRSNSASNYWNTAGLRIVNDGLSTGRFAVGDGTGSIDMFDNVWFGARLAVVNGDENAAADIVDAGGIAVRNFLLDTVGLSSNISYYTHEAGALTVQTQIELGGVSKSGDATVFRQTAGTVTVNHWDYGLRLGQNLTRGKYILDGGTASVSTVTFANPDSVFEFNSGVFAPGARDALVKTAAGGSVQLAGTGTREFRIESGYSMQLEPGVTIADKPGESGTLRKTGGGTLELDDASGISGMIDVREGMLSATTLHPDLYLLIGAAVVSLSENIAVRALSFDGGQSWASAGSWGAPGSGADYDSFRLGGSGMLQVVSDAIPPEAWTALQFSPAQIAVGLSKDNADPDGDGFDNWHEYVAGTDPTNAESVLQLSGEFPDLWFATQTGRLYAVFVSTNLQSRQWSVLTNSEGNGAGFSIIDTNRFMQGYYKVDVLLP